MQTKHFILLGAVSLCTSLGAAEMDSITTRDGTTYTNAVIQRADPDGVVIEYAPRPGSVGIAKLKFARLPEELQKRYHYNATDALTFEQNHAAGIARRQEEIARGEIEKQREYAALWQYRAEVEAALESKRQEAAANEAAQIQMGGWYDDWYGDYDGRWYAVGNRRYRYNSCGPLASVDPKQCSTSGLTVQHGGPGYFAPISSHASRGSSQSGIFAARHPAAAGKPALANRPVAAGRPTAGGNRGARGFSARSR